MAQINYDSLEFLPVVGETGKYKLSWTFTEPYKSAYYQFDKYNITWYCSKVKKIENGRVSYVNWTVFSETTYSPYLHKDIYNPDIEVEPPSTALAIYATIVPMAKNNDDPSQRLWYGQSTDTPQYVIYTALNPESTPSTPTLTIKNKNQLTISVENYSDEKAASVLFEIERTVDGAVSTYQRTVGLSNGSAVYSESAAVLGASYRARAKGLNSERGSQRYTGINGFTQTLVYGESEWSSWSSASVCAPSAPAGITALYSTSSTALHVEWSPVTTAESGYKVQWATNASYFDASSEVQEGTTASASATSYNITGIDTGATYFVRVCAVNSQGESGWTDIKSVTVGTVPDAPTTWSSATVAYVGEKAKLYLTHNSTDGSAMKVANIEIFTNGSTTASKTATLTGTGNDDVYVYELDTSGYVEGATIEWRAQTSGITNQFGAWSAKRQITVYAQPTLSLVITDGGGKSVGGGSASSYPITIKATARPDSQTAIGYHVNIVAQSAYDALSNSGENIHIAEGQSIYEQFFDESGNSWTLVLNPADVDLVSGITYAFTVTATMDSGLSCEETLYITCAWSTAKYSLDAHFDYMPDDAMCYVGPYAYTATTTVDGDDVTTDFEAVSGVTLAVYRRNADGSFTLIADGLSSSENVMVCDLHPTLDYLRYRIVGTEDKTGAITFTDLDSYYVGNKACIIQWDEEWSSYDSNQTASELAEAPASTSMLKLLYNAETSYDTTVDVSTVAYIGRVHPVSYYGTAESTSVSWKLDLVRDDYESIYQLRRLQRYHGDVYVRDPTGFGCWATVAISFERSYDSAKIPVTVAITRVDGGA